MIADHPFFMTSSSTPLLSRLKRTNEAPSDIEAKEVRAICSEALERRLRNTLQIRHLQSKAGSHTIDALRRDSSSLTRTIQRCRSILSGLRRLPLEILAYIFLLTIPSVEEHVPWYRSLKRSPWILGHICRRWRAIALATPALWSSIVIQNGSDDCEPCSIPMLKTQLIRSRNSSLVVVFECGADDENDDIVEEALSALAQCSSRWNSLTIVAQQLKRLPNIRGRVPLLEKLSVQEMLEEESDDGYDSDELSSRAIGHFAIAPRLRVVEMEIGAPFFELPWGGITHYESNGSWEDHTFALMRLRNVESCTLLFAHEFNGNERSTWGSRAVELGKLRKLDIDTERYNFGEPYWNWPNWLRVPALTSLTIGDSLLGGLAEVLQVSNCRLVELHVTGGAPTVEAIRPVFESVPDLVELGIDLSHSFVHPYGGELIALLTLKPRCSVVLAKLRTIAMDSPTVEMESAIRAMVSSRWGTTDPAVSRLQAVTITGCSVMGRRLTAKLEQLRGEGLSVSVRD